MVTSPRCAAMIVWNCEMTASDNPRRPFSARTSNRFFVTPSAPDLATFSMSAMPACWSFLLSVGCADRQLSPDVHACVSALTLPRKLASLESLAMASWTALRSSESALSVFSDLPSAAWKAAPAYVPGRPVVATGN